MYESKLDRWADYLLDTGKRSTLINFKDTKSSTVEVLLPSIKQLFSKVESNSSFEVYDPKTTEPEEEIEPAREDGAYQGGFFGRKNSKEEYQKAHAKKIKGDKVLLYNPYSNPLSVLKSIHKKARLAIEETGVNIAYMAFGFIRWKEREGGPELKAPLLLAPVLFKNASPIEPYLIQMTEDDCIVNPTFSFRMQTEYGIRLPELGEEALEDYFGKVEAIISRMGWSLERSCKIGIFSFLKLNMYHDIRDNRAKILANGNIRTLLGEKVGSSVSVSPVANLSLHNVVDADSSQLDAIRMAKEGRSFVIQGPPGTGKSQTITNLIAECLSDGKRVLFVSEKLAALSVVYEKLKNASLSDFCLELHSHKANKKEFIAELCRCLRRDRDGYPPEKEAVEASKDRYKKQLDNYAKELHLKRGGIDMSLYQILSLYSVSSHAPDVDYAPSSINTKFTEYVNEAEPLLRQYADFTEAVGTDYRKNAWYGYLSADSSYENKLKIRKQLQASIGGLEALKNVSSEMRDMGLRSSFCLGEIVGLCKIMSFLEGSDTALPVLFDKKEIIEVKTRLLSLEKEAISIRADEALASEKYTDEVFGTDAYTIRKRLISEFDNPIKRFFKRGYKELLRPLKLSRTDGKAPKYEEAKEICDTVIRRNSSLNSFKSTEKLVKDKIGDAYKGMDTDWQRVYAALSELGELIELDGDFFERIKSLEGDYTLLRRELGRLSGALKEGFSLCKSALKSFAEGFNKNIFDCDCVTVEELHAKVQGCLDNLGGFDAWCRFLNLLDKLSEADLTLFISKAIEAEIEPDLIVDAFKKSFYRAWADKIINYSPMLNEFTRNSHDKSVESFSKCEEALFLLNREEIAAKLSARRPDISYISPKSPVAILTHEGEKSRRQKSIRTLLSEVGELVQQIKPCFLMSPLSVSTYLSTNANISFDVVVFDEASQIFPQDAVGAIYRANQMIVVGDSRQMPPSNFFSTSIESDEEGEDDTDEGDYESILDLCSTSMPQIWLKWHYRSRYEQLIAFSNRNFYNGDLITFPSAITDRKGVGVDFYYVDGTYERGKRVNVREAERVVDLIYENIRNFPKRSLGVVAFSLAQQELIDKLLSARRVLHPECEKFFHPDRPEPFFIKNLETVQGDERDTIIFSIAYGKDVHGILHHNFGPLNKTGGERRLNVAVTRAKKNVQVVSSIRHTDIDITKAKSTGARLLRDYLEFAERKSVAREEGKENGRLSFEGEVAKFLSDSGYTVSRNVGCSKFKIDVAVKNTTSEDYVVAVECDGEYYRSSENTRDRERLRTAVLRAMGWSVYRVWSTEWYKNPVTEKKRLLQAVQEAIAEKTAHPETPEDMAVKRELYDKKGEGEGSAEALSSDAAKGRAKGPYDFEYYEYADIDVEAKKNPDDFIGLVRAILEKEAPLSEELLIKRMLKLLGKDKVSGVILTEFDSLMSGCEKSGIIRKSGFMYLEGKEILFRIPARGDAPRDPRYVCPEELKLGLSAIMREAPTLNKTRLFNKLNLLCGNLNLTPSATIALEEAYEELVLAE